MREIRFRAWDNQAKVMLPVVDIEYLLTKGALITDYKYFVENIYPNIMQYTGLKDKNGVEIYEGDIVRKLSGDYKLGKVVFEFGMFCFESIGCGIYAGSDAFLYIHSLHYKEYNSNNNYEVIGNIYENPEILEK